MLIKMMTRGKWRHYRDLTRAMVLVVKYQQMIGEFKTFPPVSSISSF